MSIGTDRRSRLLRLADRVRAVPGARFGLRDTTITVRVRTWSGGALAEGTATDVDTPLRVGGQNPKVRRVAYKETVAAGGRYQEGDYRVGPLTPDFPGGGVTFSTMAPPTQAGTEVYYIVTGADTPAETTVCTVVGEEGDHPLHRYLVIRPSGVVL